MYMIGSDHPNKVVAEAIMDRIIEDGERIVTDAAVFQEILHRYSATGRPGHIESAFNLLRRLADEVFPLDMKTVELARTMLGKHKGLSARDAVHAASMSLNQVHRMVTFDADFDRVPGITRISS